RRFAGGQPPRGCGDEIECGLRDFRPGRRRIKKLKHGVMRGPTLSLSQIGPRRGKRAGRKEEIIQSRTGLFIQIASGFAKRLEDFRAAGQQPGWGWAWRRLSYGGLLDRARSGGASVACLRLRRRGIKHSVFLI